MDGRFTGLTARQLQCLDLSARRYSYKEIGTMLGDKSEQTVKTHLARAVQRSGFATLQKAQQAWLLEAGSPEWVTPVSSTDDHPPDPPPTPSADTAVEPSVDRVNEPVSPFPQPDLPIGQRTWSLHEMGRWINDLSWKQTLALTFATIVLFALTAKMVAEVVESISSVGIAWYQATERKPPRDVSK